jgi:hypothetical protein
VRRQLQSGRTLASPPMKTSKADFELRHASIVEQWEVKRLDGREPADV